MVRALHGDSTQGFWIGTSYVLTSAVVMPFIASLAFIFGYPLVLLGSLVLFTIGTIVCCVADDIATMIAGRVIQGIGGGGGIILCPIIFTHLVPLRFRSKWYGFVLFGHALGTCTGEYTYAR